MLKVFELRLDLLKEYENNPRFNDGAVEKVAESIKEFGFKVPIIIDKDNTIVAGHTRYKAAQKLGLKKVPCIIADDLTAEKVKAFRLADNKVSEYSSWDQDKLYKELMELKVVDFDTEKFGFETKNIDVSGADLDEIMKQFEGQSKLEIVDDNFNVEEAIPEIPTTTPGEVWQLGIHRLICGDSTDKTTVEKLMNGSKADLFLTDPPYNINVSNSQGMTIENDNMNKTEFINFLSKAFNAAMIQIKEGAAFYIWYADTSAIEFHESCRNANMTVRENLIWVKSQFILGRQDYHWRHEPCLYGWKDGAAHYFIHDRSQSTVFDVYRDIDELPENEIRSYLKSILKTSTVLYEKKPSVNDLHPTMKPLKLIGRLINNSSKVNDLILDVFGGSGSTLIASEQLKRKCYMIEYDPKYCDVIIKRWEELTGEKAVLLK